MSQARIPATSATCAPEMARMWYVPATRNASAVSGSTPVRSPRTMARDRPCSGPGSMYLSNARLAHRRTREVPVRSQPTSPRPSTRTSRALLQ